MAQLHSDKQRHKQSIIKELEQKIHWLQEQQEQSLQQLILKEEELEEVGEEYREEVCGLKNKIIELHEQHHALQEELSEGTKLNSISRNKYEDLCTKLTLKNGELEELKHQLSSSAEHHEQHQHHHQQHVDELKEEIDRLTSELQKLTETNNHNVASFRNLLTI